jgi:hypothetical protein
MSGSERKVVVESADLLAEISIVDARYRVRQRGVGRLEVTLEPGLYIARVRSGEVTQQKSMRVDDGDVTIRFEEYGTLRSSAPTEAVVDPGARSRVLAAAPSIAAAAGSWVLLAIRHPLEADADAASAVYADAPDAGGFALVRLDGETLQEFSSIPLSRTATGHWVAAIQVGSGWYGLALPGDGGRRVVLPLYVGRRFSPSVFVELRSTRSGSSPRPNFDQLLVSYDDREADIFQDRDRMRAMELARRSLVLGRNELTPALMEILVRQKFQDPILGLFAAHLLLLDPQGDAGAFREVVSNSGSILEYPQHPDLVIVRALGRQRGWWDAAPMAGDVAPLEGPPLLRASWEALLGMRGRAPELVASDSLLRRVASSLVRSNAWVLWREQGERSTVAASSPRAAPSGGASGPDPGSRSAYRRQSADTLLGGLIGRIRENPDLVPALKAKLAESSRPGTSLERAIAQAALRLTQSEDDRPVPKGYARQLAQSIGVPLALFKENVGNVLSAIGDLKR